MQTKPKGEIGDGKVFTTPDVTNTVQERSESHIACAHKVYLWIAGSDMDAHAPVYMTSKLGNGAGQRGVAISFCHAIRCNYNRLVV